MLRKRIRYAQNFLMDEKLVESLVADSAITNQDIVYEVGPGNGIITKALAAVARKVITVEIDSELTKKLHAKLKSFDNVHIHFGNFLTYELPNDTYKVFANVPFNVTAEIVKKLLESSPPPIAAFLIIQKEAAIKFSGIPSSTEFSVLWQPWFTFELRKEIDRYKFEPVPSVQPVLFVMKQRSRALVPEEERMEYVHFIRYGFRTWKKNLKATFADVFTYTQWKRLATDLRFSITATPSELSFSQWLQIYQFFAAAIPLEKKSRILRTNQL